MTKARFTRTLKNGCVGPDVEGVGRALARAKFMGPLSRFVQKTPAVRRTWGAGKTAAVKRLQREIGVGQTGIYREREHRDLERLGAFDAHAAKLMQDYAPPPVLCFPIAGPDTDVHVGGLHETGGLPGNWALDFLCQAGSGIVAPERATVTRFSGHPPSDDTADSIGVFGWTTYLQTPKGYVWFLTHQGKRLPELKVGARVEAGDLIGWVGDQRYRPDHLHAGVSSPKGPADAKAHVLAVSKAPRAS